MKFGQNTKFNQNKSKLIFSINVCEKYAEKPLNSLAIHEVEISVQFYQLVDYFLPPIL